MTRPPPEHLGIAGAELWNATVGEVQDTDAMLACLERYCECADAIAEARQLLKQHGRYYEKDGLMRRHPATVEEAEQQRLLQGYFRQLGLSKTVRVSEKQKKAEGAKRAANVFSMQAVPNKKR